MIDKQPHSIVCMEVKGAQFTRQRPNIAPPTNTDTVTPALRNDIQPLSLDQLVQSQDHPTNIGCHSTQHLAQPQAFEYF